MQTGLTSNQHQQVVEPTRGVNGKQAYHGPEVAGLGTAIDLLQEGRWNGLNN